MVKRVLFWVVSPVTLVIYILSLLIQMLGLGIETILHMFEGWAFDMYKEGYKRSQCGGYWVKR
jgi:hypothetical protein